MYPDTNETGDGAVRRKDDRGALAARLGGREGVPRLERAERRPKSYVLEMLPYPSGTLHMGHMLVYTIGDVVTRFRARNGMHVLHPQGFDSFGLPAENAAIKEGVHPRESTERNIEHITRSMRRVGWAYDWDRSLSTHDPTYYRWQQWQFLLFLERGLAYRKGALREVVPERPDRARERAGAGRRDVRALRRRGRVAAHGAVVLPHHRLRAGAARRSRDGRLAGVDQGAPAQLDRPLGGRGDPLPDRGARRGRLRLHDASRTRCTARRSSSSRPSTSSSRGSTPTRFATTCAGPGRRRPRARAGDREDGRLHRPPCGQPGERRAAAGLRRRLRADRLRDRRDHGRPGARPARLRLRDGVRSPDPAGRAAAGRRGRRERRVRRARRRRGARQLGGVRRPCRPRRVVVRIVEKLEAEGRGRFTINYRLRDWGFSRQRYWGCPIPVVYCDACGIVPVPEDELPVVLPEIEDYKPKGVPPLAQAEDWVNVPCPSCAGPAKRETETMDTFVDSSWYFLRYCDPHNDAAPFDRAAVDYWNPIDLYIGGVDHATVHMIYARFWVKVLNELGLLGFREPFAQLLLERLGDVGQDEDVEAGGQHRRARRLRRALRRRRVPAEHPLPRPGERGHGVDRGERRGDGALRQASLARRLRGRRRRAAERADRRRRSRGRPTGRSRRSRTTSAAASRSTRRSRP